MKRRMLSTAVQAAVRCGAAAGTGPDTLFRGAAGARGIHACDVIGVRVCTAQWNVAAEAGAAGQDWQDIGEVSDILLSRDGAVEAVLVGIGGFLGIGERQVAIDRDPARFVAETATENDGDCLLVMNAARADFEAAPAREWRTDAYPATTAPVEGTPRAMAKDLAGTGVPADGGRDRADRVVDRRGRAGGARCRGRARGAAALTAAGAGDTSRPWPAHLSSSLPTSGSAMAAPRCSTASRSSSSRASGSRSSAETDRGNPRF